MPELAGRHRTTQPDLGNRRQSERFPVNADAWCPFLSPVSEETGPVKIQDVSLGGLGLLMRRRVEPGELLALTLANPKRRFSKLVLVRVVHVTTASGGYLVGGTFLEPLTYQEMSALVL